MRLTHSIASSIDFTCQSQKPAINSLVSVNGPSTTVRFAPANLTRAPFELGWRPSPASITPAFISSSLNRPISVRSCSDGRTPASESLLALTRIMNRIVVSSCLNCLYSDIEQRPAKSTHRVSTMPIDDRRPAC